MAYRIKIVNSSGTLFSRKFMTKTKAMSVIRTNRRADAKINQGGYRKASTGKLVRICNKYSLFKINKKGRK